ncbi:DNA adenine methylase [Spirochaeta isovalerica]|uniref:Adenine-specific DNA-methyltransferase n=1 Tax=Spirochaeta isovalerica TaxID=150 RepID=A0A841RFT6_9SPIO|nr:DNA adenine methylase [Spirochaeta isovalerica]MBB6481659.1 adenine-specific DNA-methyltransferase [Spirochaeta isovalerica]
MWHPIPVSEEKETDPYLTKQLIAYIGNKRSLLGFLGTVFSSLENKGDRTVFSDPFAGSGAVARLARKMGYSVLANDWEPYSKIVNSCYIGINKSDLKNLFGEYGGVEKVFREINHLDGEPSDPYISRHYAPENTEEADYHTERLFYTTENALFIDRARTWIEERYSGWDLDEKQLKEKYILLASLLYEVSTHANTSGVFKACHKGFGGHGKDALTRILAPMEMEIPHLVDSSEKMIIENLDAADFVSQNSSHMTYLDPPYNSHQYGSNYFMLNTVALWDKPPVSGDRKDDGRFVEKAGIRKDWIQTRSPFCYRKDAPGAFSGLLDSIDSRYIMLSYNTEGIIPFGELYDIMENQGRTELYCRDYILYRGGKQSLSRQNYNMELLLVLDRKEKPGKSDRKKVERFLLERKLITLLRRPFHPEKMKTNFPCRNQSVDLSPSQDGSFLLGTREYYVFRDMPSTETLEVLSDRQLETLFSLLEDSLCGDNQEEARVLINLMRQSREEKMRNRYGRRLLQVVRKFAFKKYRELFEETARELERLIADENKVFGSLSEGLASIKSIAAMRFRG